MKKKYGHPTFTFDENKRLVEEVKERPAIWDPNHERHKDNAELKTLWDAISKEMVRDNPSLTGRFY
jgi:hypothetical protein